MSLKNDIKMVKEELNSEEKFFEKAVITEKFVKKYKKYLIASVVLIAIFVAVNIAYTINEQNRVDSVNETLLQLEKKPDDAPKLARLESLSPSLHDLWLYSHSILTHDVASLKKLSSSKDKFIADLSSYEVAQNSKNLKTLNDYTNKQDAVYRDLAQVQSAIILMKENKIDEAHQELSMISIQSPLSKVAQALMHYGVK